MHTIGTESHGIDQSPLVCSVDHVELAPQQQQSHSCRCTQSDDRSDDRSGISDGVMIEAMIKMG